MYPSPYPSPKQSPLPSPAEYIHLGGAATSAPAQGIYYTFAVSNPSSTTINCSYTTVQLILTCGSIENNGVTTYYGTVGQPAVLDELDGRIPQAMNLNGNSSFSLSMGDSPGLPLPTPVPAATPTGSASELDGFSTYLMYKYNVNSDSKTPNIWVPLAEYNFWDWYGSAELGASRYWTVPSGTTPTVATVTLAASNAEPVWGFVYPYYGPLEGNEVSQCQAF